MRFSRYGPLPLPLSLDPLSSHYDWPSQECWQGSGPAAFFRAQATPWELYMCGPPHGRGSPLLFPYLEG